MLWIRGERENRTVNHTFESVERVVFEAVAAAADFPSLAVTPLDRSRVRCG
jgi:hypothetical protein